MRVKRTPSYCRDKATGQAVGRIDGHDFYLGKHGSEESQSEYNRLIAEWYANNQNLPQPAAPAPVLSVNELLLAFWRWAEQHYRDADGRAGKELDNLK